MLDSTQVELKIGEVASLSGVSVKTVRYYEEIGLLSPVVERSQSGYRLFNSQVLKRLAFIKRSQSLGLRLEEIQDILKVYDQGLLPCPEVKQHLESKVADISQKIAALSTLQSELQEILAHWQEQKDQDTVISTVCPNIQ